MSCVDCKGATLPLWTRCYDCALRVLRRLMSPFPVTETAPARRYGKGARVWVTPRSSDAPAEESVRLAGEVVRRQGTTYVVQLLSGQRYYAEAAELAPREEVAA